MKEIIAFGVFFMGVWILGFIISKISCSVPRLGIFIIPFFSMFLGVAALVAGKVLNEGMSYGESVLMVGLLSAISSSISIMGVAACFTEMGRRKESKEKVPSN